MEKKQKGREVLESVAGCQLRESTVSYDDGFTIKKQDIDPEIGYLWNTHLKIST
jgi:hypothetical protein